MMANSLAQHSLTRIIVWQLCKSGSGLSLAIVHPLKHLTNSVQKSLEICLFLLFSPIKLTSIAVSQHTFLQGG